MYMVPGATSFARNSGHIITTEAEQKGVIASGTPPLGGG
jgi:hypothetical protein